MENTAKNQKQKIATIGVLVIVVIVAGYYMYRDMKDKNVAPTSGTTDVGIDATGEFTVEQLPVEDIAPGMKIPNLKRDLVFTAQLPDDAKRIIQDNIKQLTESLMSDPTRFGDWLDLGIQYQIAGDYTAAREVWEYAGYLSPESHIPWDNLGGLYTNYLKNYPKAEENYKKAIQKKPDHIAGYRSLYELYRYSYKEKESLADDILLQGLTKNPKSTDLMILLAQYYKETGDKAQALTYYNKALAEAQAQGNTALADLLKQEIQTL